MDGGPTLQLAFCDEYCVSLSVPLRWVLLFRDSVYVPAEMGRRRERGRWGGREKGCVLDSDFLSC